jgi:2-polyprenyl-3-methyl-5-hydroxy-6-metoxy-1,4-benzoquinol methylase
MRRIIGRFIDRICAEVDRLSPRTIVDLGCGEGIVARELGRRLDGDFEYLGLDLNPESIAFARQLCGQDPRFSFEVADILALEPRLGWADVGLCLEVLEHLPAPRDALSQLQIWTHGTVIVSVPWEPWFRLGNLLRGRHVMRLGNHPEHLHQFTPRSFQRLLAEHSDDASVGACFPWLIGELGATGPTPR